VQLQCFILAWIFGQSLFTFALYTDDHAMQKGFEMIPVRSERESTVDIIDISVSLSETITVYDGDPPFRLDPDARLTAGDPCSFNTSVLRCGSHVGTHVDAPRHFYENAPGVDVLDLSVLCGMARLVDVRGCGPRIDDVVLSEHDLTGVERLLLRTDSEGWARARVFDKGFAHLTLAAALLIRRIGVKLVGIDSPSVDSHASPDMSVHRVLMDLRVLGFDKRNSAERLGDGNCGVVIVEGLDLTGVEAGDYELTCLPMKIVGGDGAPARAILRRVMAR